MSSAIWDTLGHLRHPHEPDMQDIGPFGRLHSDGVAPGRWWGILQSILDGSRYLWLSNWIVPLQVDTKIEVLWCAPKSHSYSCFKVEANSKASYNHQSFKCSDQWEENSQTGEYLAAGIWRWVFKLCIIFLGMSSLASHLLTSYEWAALGCCQSCLWP